VIPAFVNPGAGRADEVTEALHRAGCFDMRSVPPHQIGKAVRAAIDAGATRIAAVGGDGTVSAVASGVIGSAAAMVVIPAGTLNHFAKDNGIPTDLDEACSLARDGMAMKMVDVAWVNDRLILNTSSVGVYANFVRVRERFETRYGYWLSSIVAMVRTLARVRPFTLWLETDRVQRSYETPLVFIGLGERDTKLPTLGGRVDGGRPGLHILVVRGRTRARLIALAFAATARGIRAMTRTPHLDSYLVSACTIEQRHSTVAIDGEVVTLASPLEYRLAREALRVVVHPGDRAAR
jgi:diacylglycerol kinase family enzyme